jgi:amidase
MATLQSASASSKDIVSSEIIRDLLSDLGLELPPKELEEWKELIASVQDSIDVVEDLPDYVPHVDLKKFPRENIHRPEPCENSGNAWAWKVRIDGEAEGSLKGLTFCLKDNIAVKDVPMLVGTDIFTDYTPNVDASKLRSPNSLQRI